MNASPHLPSLACSSHDTAEPGGATSASQPVQFWSCEFELLPLLLPPAAATPQWPA